MVSGASLQLFPGTLRPSLAGLAPVPEGYECVSSGSVSSGPMAIPVRCQTA
jgi:hypothetical protein